MLEIYLKVLKRQIFNLASRHHSMLHKQKGVHLHALPLPKTYQYIILNTPN